MTHPQCTRCHRPLTRPGVVSGSRTYGPKCAQVLGLVPAPKAKAALFVAQRPARRDEATMDLFGEVAP